MVVRITIRRVGALALNEVAPPGWGHTKAEKEKTKPDKPKSKIGGSAAAFDRARKEGRFKGSKADMFKLMWSMKKKGAKPHYKPGTDEKKKKYQEEETSPMPNVSSKDRGAINKRAKNLFTKDEKGTKPGVNEQTSMKDNNLFGNAYAGSYEDLKKKVGSKKKHDKPAIKENKFVDAMVSAVRKKKEEKKPEKAMDAGARAKRKLARKVHRSTVSDFVPKELEDQKTWSDYKKHI